MESRNDILSWINSTLGLSYTKIEDMHSGAAYCLLFDHIHPGIINVSRVNLNANDEYQYDTNFRLLQNGFAKVGISKEIPIQTLKRGKYQGNLEFCQWFKRYFDSNYTILTNAALAGNSSIRKSQEQRKKDQSLLLDKGKKLTSSNPPSTPSLPFLSVPEGGGTGGTGRPLLTASAKTPKINTKSNFSTPVVVHSGSGNYQGKFTAPLSMTERAEKNHSLSGSSGSSSNSSSRVLSNVTNIGQCPTTTTTTSTTSNSTTSATTSSTVEDFIKKEYKYKERIAQLELALENAIKEKNCYFQKLVDIEIYTDRYTPELSAATPSPSASPPPPASAATTSADSSSLACSDINIIVDIRKILLEKSPPECDPDLLTDTDRD